LEPLLRAGPDHVLWALFDQIVDGYFPFTDRLEEIVDRLQNSVVDKPNRETLEELFALKRQLIAVRRAVSPVREILNQLTNRELSLIDAEELIYFRDIYDHVIRLTDELDTDRELVAATVEIYLSTINNNLSTIMKRLTGVTVILAGAGAIAGIFGMSEAGLAFSGAEAGGFWTVTALVVVLTAVAAVILRRIDWI
ncbi:MAG TPA: CorA family divalent cation transporter, partial [Candidatus Limnocylindrales bacterium]|nr:CorA family divalent cation transporter [Candidatus Limnocylindrales bacterium]